MMSLRTAARAAPRTSVSLVSSTSRLATSTGSAASRFAAARSSSMTFRPMPTMMKNVAAAAFSTSTRRMAEASASSAEVDKELSAKLQSEIAFEEEIRENEPEPTSVSDFLASGLFEVEDVPGREDVILRRTHGDEKITVTFSVADLANYDPDFFEDDAALADGEEAGVQQQQQQQQQRRADESSAVEEDEEAEDDVDAASVPCRLSIVIEKPGQGALSVEATAQEGQLVVDNLYYYGDAAHAHEATAEAAHDAQRVYPGPDFASLDEDLQTLVDRYLEERGITSALAVFVPEYLDAKEQREYLGFLNKLKGFVDA